MNPDRMRMIDRHVGVPLCFVASFLRKLFARAPRPEAPPKNILFIELSEMGSTILADPAMRKAQSLWGADLYFVIFADNRGSLDFLQTIPKDNIFTLRVTNLFMLGIDSIAFLLWCRRKKIDMVVDLELFSRFTALLTGLSGAARRIGFHRFHNEGLYRGEMLTHRVAYNPHIHIAKNFMALILAAAAGEEQIPYTKEIIADDAIRIAPISVPDAEIAAIRAHIVELVPEFAKPMRLLLLNPNASEMLPQRRWPSENFVALARLALARWEDLLILVTGAPSERLEADALCQRVGNPRMVNFAGHSRLDQLPALYSLADLMVTNDSGPGHFASVTSLPTITLFGPETPALYGALGENAHPISAGLACSPCVSAANHRKTACSQPVCMERISPETVFALVETLLLRA